jgi:GMP synthase (glutamine-hydrolysing)
MEMPGTKQRHEHTADRAVYDLAGRTWLATFLNHWLALPDAKEKIAV